MSAVEVSFKCDAIQRTDGQREGGTYGHIYTTDGWTDGHTPQMDGWMQTDIVLTVMQTKQIIIK